MESATNFSVIPPGFEKVRGFPPFAFYEIHAVHGKAGTTGDNSYFSVQLT